MKTVCLIIFMCAIFGASNAQDFSCTFGESIMRDIRERGRNFDTYSSLRNNKISSYGKGIDLIERIKIETKLKDSLRECCGHQSFFDDRLFHLATNILLVDTFNFFKSSCLYSTYGSVVIVNRLIGFECIPEKYDVVFLQSIRVYKNNFIITLRHIYSDQSIDFKFEIISNEIPKLIKVERCYLE